MASAEFARRAAARLWPDEPDRLVLWHGQGVRLRVPGLVTRSRRKRFLMGLVSRLVMPDWLWLFRTERPTLVRADEPAADAVHLAQALAPARVPGLREEGVSRLPWLIITATRVGVFDAVAGEAALRWTGAPVSIAAIRRGRGWYARLTFLDGSLALVAISETEARTLPSG